MNIGDIGPHLLQDKRHRSLGWSTAISELIDNSFDAAATRVELDFSKAKQLTVVDDGNGCPNIQRMLTIADHMPSKSTALGRYGVGLKDAACWLWGEMKVDSVFRGKAISASVNWEKLSKQKDWEIADPIEYEPTEELPRGTKLRFLKHDRNRPHSLEKLSDELGYTFWPALSSGKQIVITGQRTQRFVCKAWTPPPLADIIEDAFTVDGKHVALRVGIVPPDDSNEHSGFNFAFGHRNICNSSLGSNGLSTSRICGIVTLGEGWRLSTNKTSICDDQESLAAALWERCKAILEKSQSHAESIFNRELESSVSESLRSYLAAKKKACRQKGESSGSATPTRTGQQHRKAKRTQNKRGNIEDKIDVGRLRMEWKPRDDGRLGSVDLPGAVVYMNPEHARLKQHREQQNREAIVDQCLTLVTVEVFDRDEKKFFPFAREHDSIVDALSNLTNGIVGETSNAKPYV